MTQAGGPAFLPDAPVLREPGRSPPLPDAHAIDPVAFAEAAVAGVLGLVCVNPHARRRLGLTAASRRADGWPAWYLWLAGSPGAYELALLPPAPGQAAVAGADFVLRYFPHPDGDAFATFAHVEQQARSSPLFDHTGTPAIATMHELDPSLFHVATLSLRPSADGDHLTLTLEAQDVWLETAETDQGPQARRAVPGLALAAPVVDFLVCARAYCGRQAPTGFVLVREPGLAWHIHANGGAQPSNAAGVGLFTLRLGGLAALGVPDSFLAPRDDENKHSHPGQSVVHRHDGPEPPERVAPFASNDWWKAASWRFYPVGAMCGCQVDEATVVGRDAPAPRARRKVRR